MTIRNKKAKNPLPLLGACVATLALAAPPSLAKDVDITLLLVADVYKMEGVGPRGGFSRAAAVAREERENNDNVIYVHAGDTLSPSIMSSLDMGRHVVQLLNVEAPDVFVPGNHEFDFGPEVFAELVLKDLDSNIVASNLRDGKGKPVAGVLDARYYEFDGVRVGMFGLVTDETPVLSSPGNEYTFLPMVETANKMAAKLREFGADIVVAVVHDSFAVDYEIMDKVDVDVVLGGSDHDLNVQYNGKVAFAEPRSDAEYLIAVDLSVNVEDDGERRRVRWWPNFRIIDTKDYEPAPDAAQLVARYESRLDEALGEMIGKTTTPLDSRRATVRGGEAAFGNLIADAIRTLVDSDVAISNGGGIRANKQYPAGSEISRRDIFTELPFGNHVVKIEVTGKQLREALENGVSQIEDGGGRFPHVSGLSMEVDTTANPGSRVKSVLVQGKQLDDATKYTVATNDYMAGGGDGYGMFAKAKVLLSANDTQLLATAVIEHIASQGTVSPKVEGRIKLTP